MKILGSDINYWYLFYKYWDIMIIQFFQNIEINTLYFEN